MISFSTEYMFSRIVEPSLAKNRAAYPGIETLTSGRWAKSCTVSYKAHITNVSKPIITAIKKKAMITRRIDCAPMLEIAKSSPVSFGGIYLITSVLRVYPCFILIPSSDTKKSFAQKVTLICSDFVKSALSDSGSSKYS